MAEGASLYIYDSAIIVYKNIFADYVEKGYVFENEFYELDYGQFMIFTSPYYNDGRYDEKGINIFIKGAHQKNYAHRNDSFRLPIRAEVGTYKVNEEQDVIYLIYDLDGEKYGVVLQPKRKMLSIDIIEEVKFSDFATEQEAIDYLEDKL